MELSEILRIAEFAEEEWLPLSEKEDVYAPPSFIKALIVAAELLKQVEVIEEGKSPREGDLISHKIFGHGKYYSNFTTDFAECKGWELIQIEKRGNHPVITLTAEQYNKLRGV